MPNVENLEALGQGKRPRAESIGDGEGDEIAGVEVELKNNEGTSLPRKKFYRARAHCNPLSDSFFPVPAHPDDYNWEEHYPEFFAKARAKHVAEGGKETEFHKPKVRFADVGCGFGGLLVHLSPMFPNDLAVGMEIR